MSNWLENPPSWATEEDLWEEAYWSVEPYWDKKEEPWAVVATIYKKKLAAMTPVKRRQKAAERRKERKLLADADYMYRSVTPSGRKRKGVKRLTEQQLDVLMMFQRARRAPKWRRGIAVEDGVLYNKGASPATLKSLVKIGYLDESLDGYGLTLLGQAMVF
jgi:hypothetical protein